MFETAELGRKVAKAEYEKAVPELRMGLLNVQNELRENPQFSVVIVIAGVDGAGKGSTVNILHEWMDPRYLEAHAFGQPTQEEAEQPPMWRFWRVLPPVGRIGIFFGSWYTDPILRRVYGKTNDSELDASLDHVKTFEDELANDRTLILKFWFHLSKKVQKKRLKSLSKDPRQKWRVTKRDWDHFELYDDFVRTSERALRETSSGQAPWTIVEGADPRYRHLTVAQHVLDAIEGRLRNPPPPRSKHAPPKPREHRHATILDTLDLSQTVDDKTYRRELEELQGRLAVLSRKARKRKDRPAGVLVFEGSDAAGKGGCIRRVTAAIDARFYRVIPIAVPTDEEAARHYLWRFWRQLPRPGHLTIFDRSWYGRVLVERVEGFAREDEWRRSYREINEFEQLLHDHGIAVCKFWLHVDRDEQARRFEAREKTPYKKYKITADDYRNREKWPLYEDAVNEMVERTSTGHAPWTLIEANDKRHARLKVLRTLCQTVEAANERSKRR